MPNYIKFSPYFIELNKICEEKNWDDKTIEVLKKWLLSILMFYNPSNDILKHFSVEEYIQYNFEKLKQTKDIKILKLKEILINPQSLLYHHIRKIPFSIESSVERFSKKEKNFIADEHGEYYLSAKGVCHGHQTIELLDETGIFFTLHHELQHINQNYVYPSEFPFANDMLKMLNEGESEYHRYLNMNSNFYPIDEDDEYYIYYLVYTILMLIIPKKMCDSWNKVDNMYVNFKFFSDLFQNIADSEKNRNHFSHIFALATLIIASCNSENTKEIFNDSIQTSIKRCSKKLEGWNQMISFVLESDKKNRLEGLQFHVEAVSERINILQNPALLLEKYREIISDEKEFIECEPNEKQEKLLQELQLFTLDRFESILKEEIESGEESIRKYQDKKEQSPQEILGEENYKQYQYYQFGTELSKQMRVLLKQELTFTELFQQFLEKMENYLIERKDSRLDEKLSFLDEIRKKCLINSKKI